MRCSVPGGGGAAHGVFFPRPRGHVAATEVAQMAERAIGALEIRMVDQVHGTDVVSWESAVEPGACQADGVILSEPGQWAAIRTADCVPVILAAGEAAVAVVHAGWRGSAGGIAGLALAALLARSGAKEDEVTCVIGPHIGPCCYEVSEDVADRFRSDWGDSVWRSGNRGRPHLDLAAIQRAQLAGLSPSMVHVSPVCTRCGPLPLPSYRRDGREAARLYTVAGISSRLVSEGEGA